MRSQRLITRLLEELRAKPKAELQAELLELAYRRFGHELLGERFRGEDADGPLSGFIRPSTTIADSSQLTASVRPLDGYHVLLKRTTGGHVSARSPKDCWMTMTRDYSEAA